MSYSHWLLPVLKTALAGTFPVSDPDQKHFALLILKQYIILSTCPKILSIFEIKMYRPYTGLRSYMLTTEVQHCKGKLLLV